MKRSGVWIGGLLGGLSAFIFGILGEVANSLLGLPGIAFTLFDWLARHLPGPLITLFISAMVKGITELKLGPTALVAKQIEQAFAILIFMAIGVVFGLVLAATHRNRPEKLAVSGVWGGLILLIPLLAVLVSLKPQAIAWVVSVLWLGVLFLGWGWILGTLISFLAWQAAAGGTDPARRKFLYLVGVGSFTVLVSAAGIRLASQNPSIPNTGSAAGSPPGPETIANAATTSGPAQSPTMAELAMRFQPVPGTRPELTANPDFYRIDIDAAPIKVDGATWRLNMKGLVNHPLNLTLDEIRSRPAVSQAVTLECISNEVGGDLTSTSLWTGVRLKDILAEAGMQPEAKEIYMICEDGYYESMPISEAMDERTLLVYAMNGEPLTTEHGFPLRIYIPNHFGMKQPKWLAVLKLIDYEGPGYWVDRSWSDEAIPPVTSVIDAVKTDTYDPATGLIPIGGIAYAGARGISQVEIQVDNGPWETVELRTPPLSPLTWVQWRYYWKARMGQHSFQVRAYDGTGQVQSDKVAPPYPDGATGLDSVTSEFAVGEDSPPS
jgi:DMSO/TMAO reductase YedYZ molybdopterin-dependent catalytic subunit